MHGSPNNYEMAAAFRQELDLGGYSSEVDPQYDMEDPEVAEKVRHSLAAEDTCHLRDPEKDWVLQPGDIVAAAEQARLAQEAEAEANGEGEEGQEEGGENELDFSLDDDDAEAEDEGDYKKVDNNMGKKKKGGKAAPKGRKRK